MTLWWWHEWSSYAEAHNITVCQASLPGSVLAVLINPATIMVADWLFPESRALVVWHEIGHHTLHVGTADDWMHLVLGKHLVWRYERQAWNFALTFPIWEPDALETAIRMLASFGSLPHGLRTALSCIPFSSV